MLLQQLTINERSVSFNESRHLLVNFSLAAEPAFLFRDDHTATTITTNNLAILTDWRYVKCSSIFG